MATITPISKHNASLTGVIRHGKDLVLQDIQNYTFTTVIFPDGTQLKDVTFAQLADAVWTLVTKHNATLTTQTKN